MTIPEMTDHEILIEIWCDMKEAKESLVSLRKTLYGNGAVGLVAKVDRQEEKVRDLFISMANRDRMVLTISGAVGVLILGLLWGILTGQVQVIFN